MDVLLQQGARLVPQPYEPTLPTQPIRFSPVNIPMIRQIREAVNDCSERGLVASARWLARFPLTVLILH